jgi:mannose-6-phosphate isomerase-like protein (cupin superfamily)
MKAEGTMTSAYADVEPFITKDGSQIRELMHPTRHGNRAQSLAEATVAVGMTTALHHHRSTEEIYHITQGQGRMTLGAAILDVGPGDTICIAPGTPHRIENIGREALKILCACAPAYSHEDTDLL